MSTPRVYARLQTLALACIVVGFPLFRIAFSSELPAHDTLQPFNVFQYFYQSLVFDNTFPQWLAYGSFGIPSDLWFFLALSPPGFLTALAGKLIGARDVLVLFRFSVALEGMVLLSGVYWLCREFFNSFAARVFVLLAMGTCLHWSTQIWWNFRLYYMVPWVLYFLYRFFASGKGNSVDLMMAALLAITGLIGSLPYFAPVHGVLFLVFIGGCLLTNPSAKVNDIPWKHWRRWIAGVAAVAVLAGCYALSGSHSLALLQPFEGHDADSMGVSTVDFLTYSRNAPFGEVLRSVVLGWPVISSWLRYPDQTLYMGILPLFLFGWACVRVRERTFLAWLAPTVFIIWFSMAGMFAFLFFLVPGFQLLRHLGLLLPMAKLFIIIGAGFGFEDFIARQGSRRFLVMAAAIGLMADSVFDTDLAIAFLRWIVGYELEPWQAAFFRRSVMYILGALAIPAALFLAAKGSKRSTLAAPIASVALIALLACDLFSYHQLVSRFDPSVSREDESFFSQLFQAQPLKYAERRNDPDAEPDVASYKRYIQKIQIPGMRAGINTSVLMMFQWDLCKGVRTVFQTASVASLAGNAGAENPWRDAILQCELPKAFLMPADSAIENANPGSAGPPAVISNGLGSVRASDFSANDVRFEANVLSADGAYLVYSDAFAPAWSVSVDGQKSTVLKALSAFKAVRVPAGAHTVHFAIERSWVLNPTWIVEVLGAAVLAGLAALLLVRTNAEGRSSPYRISNIVGEKPGTDPY